jgi:hypothetical protein
LSKNRVASVAEWRALGLTTAQFRSLVRSGELVRVWYGVYATGPAVKWAADNPMREHAVRVLAARVAAGREMVASHHSAALIHGLALYPQAPDLVALTRPSGWPSHRRKADGLIVHAAELPAEHTIKRYGVPVTTVARTVVDIARGSSFMSGVVTADFALNAGLVMHGQLVAVGDACDRWPGIRKARRVVEFSDPRAESVLESCARVIFQEHGLPAPELQMTIGGARFSASVDFCWPQYRVIAEADGAMKYADPERAIKQLRRDQQLRDAGYKVVHFTWHELFGASAMVVDRIRRAFVSSSAV